MIIKDRERQLIINHAEDNYPYECCGVLLGNVKNHEVAGIVANDNDDPDDIRDIHFSIDPLKLLKLERFAKEKGLDIVGFYHSHNDHPAIPSKEDEKHMIPGLLYVIAGVREGEFAELKCYTRASFDDKVVTIS
jgi:proteasome lid subunit RPN8/RPN11